MKALALAILAAAVVRGPVPGAHRVSPYVGAIAVDAASGRVLVRTVINQYHQDPRKCYTVHNAVYPLPDEYQAIPRPDHTGRDKVVTFLGRITMQKGPEYFVEAANMVNSDMSTFFVKSRRFTPNRTT